MLVEFERPFVKDIEDLPKPVKKKIEAVIHSIERSNTLQNIPNLKKLEGPGSYYRVRIGNYRLGFRTDGETCVVMRCLHRREIYRRFP